MHRGLLAAAVSVAAFIGHAQIVSAADLSLGMVKCGFIPTEFKFQGSELQQASCLLRSVRPFGHIDPQPARLPNFLKSHIGKPVAHRRERLVSYLASLGLDEARVGGALSTALSRANDNDAGAPQARYFVIHDTSSELEDRTDFPADLNTADVYNNLSHYNVAEPVAHLFVNRRGEILAALDLSTPWRAVRLENSDHAGIPSKGLFIHVEMIQHRIKHPNHPNGYYSVAPTPGFTDRQYSRLALLYLVASTRAGRYLIPGFHGSIDEGISGAHDDPQKFDLRKFDDHLVRISKVLTQRSNR